MPLQKQSININFAQGLDLKTDPRQVAPGKFLSLKNSVFNKGGLLQKRNGYASLTQLTDTSSTTLTTYQDNLIAVGDNLNVYSQDSQTWYNRGALDPLELSTLAMVRNSTSQTSCDIAIDDNGLSCTVFNQSTGGSAYQIQDSITGQIIVAFTALPNSGINPRVFVLGSYFIILYAASITGTRLQYIAVPANNPTQPLAAVSISNALSSIQAPFDGYVKNNKLYFAFNGSAGGGQIFIYSLSSTLIVSAPKSITGHVATQISVTADQLSSVGAVWVSYLENSTNDVYSAAFDTSLNVVLASTLVLDNIPVASMVSIAYDRTLTLIYETTNTYTASTVRSDFVSFITCSQTGGVGSAKDIRRSVGIASKPFYLNSNIYFLSVYGGELQPTYFLLDIYGNIVCKLAYSNAFGYAASQVLPSVNVSGQMIKIGYLYNGQLLSVNKTQGVTDTTGVYAQTGVNLATFTINNDALITTEIANNLHLTGGYLWMYDGDHPVEEGFHVWPEDILATPSGTGGGMSAQIYFYQMTYEWTDAKGNLFRSAPSVPLELDLSSVSSTPVTFTSVFSSGDETITVSSLTGLFVGQELTDSTTGANITPGTTITAINVADSEITLSLPTAGNSAISPGDTLSTSDTLSVDLQIPTLRLTLKDSPNPVRIVIYRWSTAQQIYYQDTLIADPLLNDLSVDTVDYTDTQNDSAILGNVILYTTGGVVENIGAPACSTQTLFKTRLMLLDSEDRNLIWYSKQVIENTSVEMSDLFTIYVAPTVSAQGSTGNITALSAMDDKLIIFKKNAIYYLTGNGPDNTGANNDFSDPVFITSTVGCTNQKSIVFMPQGLMFQSDKGIWLLGRDLSSNYIGASVEEFNSSFVQSAVNIPGTNQVRFTLDTGVTLMYDYYFGQWGTFTNVPAISSTIYENLHTYLNQFGQVFQESIDAYLDGSNPVLMSFTTSWFNMMGIQAFQRAYFFFLLGNYITPHQLSIGISYDYNPTVIQTTVVNPINYSPAWGGDALWGSGENWGGSSTVEQWRIFLSRQKCESFQITLNEMYDPTYGVKAGAGFTLSGLNLVIGAKSGYPRVTARTQTS